jgi:hypothetical protein
MRANSIQLIKSYCTRPDSYRDDPAAKTELIGLQADAQVVMVFASSSRQFNRDGTMRYRLPELRRLDNLAWTRKLSSINRNCAKTR